MSCPRLRSRVAPLGVAVVLAVAAALLAAPAPAAAAAAATGEDAHLAQMRAAQSGAADDSANGGVEAQQDTALACFGDPEGDTTEEETGQAAASAQADIVEHCVAYGDSLTLSVRVAAPTNPATDPNWREATFVGWFVDVDGDRAGDFFVDYSLNAAGALAAQVLDVRTGEAAVACDVAASFDGARYAAGPIPAECLDAPASVSATVAVFYNDGGEAGPVYRDTAPNDGTFTTEVDQDPGVCTNPLPAPFADRGAIAEVHRANVDCLFARGITIGVVGEDGLRRFLPHPSITRGQFSAFTFRTFADAGVGLPPPRTPAFDDVPPGRVFHEEIHRLAAAGVLLGYAGTNLFGPQDPIRRDQTASVLVRALEHALGRTISPAQPGTYFSDIVGNFHEDNIDAAFEEGLVEGVRAPTATTLGLYAPAAHTTRQQMASVIVRFLRHLEEDA